MNNLVNIAEFSKKTKTKTYYVKSNLIKFVNKNYNWIMDAYTVRTKRYKMDPFIILYPA